MMRVVPAGNRLFGLARAARTAPNAMSYTWQVRVVSAGRALIRLPSLSEFGEEVWSIADAYGVWKFGSNIHENSGQQFIPRAQ